MRGSFRIAILGASPCGQCGANCCKQNGHDFAVLLRPHEYARFGPFSSVVEMESDGGRVWERVLPYVGGRCQFLGLDDRCTIYEDRPQSCREFECLHYYNQNGTGRHGRFLKFNPAVRELLDRL
jgi:Fe-S-cluster containining protein